MNEQLLELGIDFRLLFENVMLNVVFVLDVRQVDRLFGLLVEVPELDHMVRGLKFGVQVLEIELEGIGGMDLAQDLSQVKCFIK